MTAEHVAPYFSDPDVTVYLGHCLDVLAALPEKSVQCVVTSPPYYGLRAYGTPPQVWPDGWVGELGQEDTLARYLDHLLSVFDAVKRVLRDDGTCWVNIGDSFNAYNGNRGATRSIQNAETARPKLPTGYGLGDPNLKPKDLLLVPFHFAIRMQAAGWYVRNDNIWAKTACMPESVRDRATRSHEYVFHFAKSDRYYYDAEAVKEGLAEASFSRAQYARVGHAKDVYGDGMTKLRNPKTDAESRGREIENGTRNQRTVWTIGPEPFRGAELLADYVGVDGKPRKVSPDCPVHGQWHDSHTRQTGECDAPPAALSRHSLGTSSCPDQAPSPDDVSTPLDYSMSSAPTPLLPTRGNTGDHRTDAVLTVDAQTNPRNGHTPRTSGDSLDWPVLAGALPATPRSNETRRTDPAQSTMFPNTLSAGNSARTGDTTASPSFVDSRLDTTESNTSEDEPERDSSPSEQTTLHNSGKQTRQHPPNCTCEIITSDHYAAYPSEIPRRCILAGTSERGACPACGAAWRRVVERSRATFKTVPDPTRITGRKGMNRERQGVADRYVLAVPQHEIAAMLRDAAAGREEEMRQRFGSKWDHWIRTDASGARVPTFGDASVLHQLLGVVIPFDGVSGIWSPACKCPPADPIPQTVLDPFLGSGRTAAVARRLGRHCIGIELQPEYAKMIRRQLRQQALPLIA